MLTELQQEMQVNKLIADLLLPDNEPAWDSEGHLYLMDGTPVIEGWVRQAVPNDGSYRVWDANGSYIPEYMAGPTFDGKFKWVNKWQAS